VPAVEGASVVSEREVTTQFPDFENLYERHGLSHDSCNYMAVRARVALARHHASPKQLRVALDDESRQYTAHWRDVTVREKLSSGNTDNTTEFGAYCLALAAVEVEYGLVGIAETERKTGADYWVDAKPEADDDYLERAVRLEVSGTDGGNLDEIRRRLKSKMHQTTQGTVSGPAIAAVIGFLEATILLSDIDVSRRS
jgi:hypothetical protein